jgi:hypothetical protein
MRKLRTQAGEVELNKNGKFSVSFETYTGEPGSEYLVSSCTSAPVFLTEDDALAGQRRALDYLEFKGRFPNMCENF